MKKPVFTGAGVAIITPFKSTGEVNYEEFGRIIDHQIAHHTDAIIVCGTTGEASALHDKEHREVLAWCCEYVNHRVPVIAGTGSNHTDYAIALTKFAAECGADAGLSVTPYYNKTTQRGLIAHYNAIADCSDLPIILYNVPSRTGVCLASDTIAELSKHPNINGIKAASGNFTLLAETMAKCGDNLNVWSGNDDEVVPVMALGGASDPGTWRQLRRRQWPRHTPRRWTRPCRSAGRSWSDTQKWTGGGPGSSPPDRACKR